MKLTVIIVCAAALVAASCSSDSGGRAALAGNGQAQSATSDIDVCSLLTDAELISVLGDAPVPSESDPIGSLIGCSWGTGRVILSIRPADALILGPDEDQCPSPGLGDESVSCPGRVKFLTNGIHASVTTIERVDETQLIAIANIVLPKLQG